jgi:hypothetical protein
LLAQPRIFSTEHEQFVVCAALDDPAMIDY